MIKYRLQWPFLIEDCHECGKGLHFRSLWKRVYKPGELSSATSFIISQAREVMEFNEPSFSKEAIVLIPSLDLYGPRIYPTDSGVWYEY